jgi:hypothetical protein
MRDECSQRRVNPHIKAAMNDTPTPFLLACRAVRRGRCLELSYAGHERVVEVHITGFTSEGEPLMRVWQVRGGSTSGQPTGWKMFHLGQVQSARLSIEPSSAPREGYQPHDPVIRRVMCQV